MAASRSLVSIVTPCYVRSGAEADLLHETLRTVAAQTCSDYELIVVDDGSPFDIGELVSAQPRAKMLRRRNGGSAQARNTGIGVATGEYLVFLDADDHLLPQAIETGLRWLSEHPGCGWTVGPHEEMTFDGAQVPWTVPPPPSCNDLYLSLLRFDWYIIPPSSAMFRRHVVSTIGGFRDPWGADDLDFYLRASLAAPAWCGDAPPVTRYRRYAESSSRDGERMLRSIRTVYARQWPHVRGNATAEEAYYAGLALLTEIFSDCLVENIRDRVRARQWRRAFRAATMLAKESPRRFGYLLADATSSERYHSIVRRRPSSSGTEGS